MELSERGYKFLKSMEGFVAHIYYDVAGNATIGYGHLLTSEDHFTSVTKQQACELLKEDVQRFEEAVNDFVHVPLEQHHFDSMVSFCYNVGIRDFATSTLLKLLNQGKFDEVPAQLLRWVNAGGSRIEGLVRRRNAEVALWKGEQHA